MQKLELTWIGKGSEPAVEPRILLHDASKDYGDPAAENMLIHGDNLLALKALEQQYAGQVKCIYIDPPYNTGSAFEHYDDNLEHSTWLSLMVPRLQILRNLLSKDGSLWISIDDDEGHYLKVLCDEVFGRSKFISTIVWQKRYSRENREAIGDSHDFILVYAIDPERFKETRNFLPLTDKQKKLYKNPDNDPRGPWQSVSLLAQGFRPNQMYEITSPSGNRHLPPEGNCWKVIRTEYEMAVTDNRVYFGSDGQGVPRRKQFLSESKGLVPWSWWNHEDFGHTDEAKKESIELFGASEAFSTPKPERLISQILQIASNPGDLVLDSFLGSGTTAAVAHKMSRRYIGIELGEHCYTHCLPRLKAVVDGEQGGISRSVKWQGGSGFKFYELASTLIIKDKHGNPIIDTEKYNPEMLAAAVAKLNGFIYAPDPEVFWKQGKNVENSFIYITTQFLTAKELDDIARDLPDYEKLLICAPAFDTGLGKRYDNIDVRKIPQSVLNKCEFGKDNYNLNIVNPPELDEEEWDDAE
jgi:adenine-specific DNA-methyltransferase